MYGQRLTIYGRCNEVVGLLNSGEIKDYGGLYRSLLSEMFGYCVDNSGIGSGWNLTAISRKNNSRDFQGLLYFLGSGGPMINDIIYKYMTADIHAKFPFPLQYLKDLIHPKEFYSNPFLASRLGGGGSLSSSSLSESHHHHHPHHPPAHLLLNPFEFYFFHFFYALVKPGGGNGNGFSSSGWTAGDSLYPLLLEDYMSFFLPSDGTEVSNPPFSIHSSSTPMSPIRLPANVSGGVGSDPSKSPPSAVVSPSAATSPKNSLLKKQGGGGLSLMGESSSPPFYNNGPANAFFTEKIWRSEVLINIISLFWLNDDPRAAEEEEIHRTHHNPHHGRGLMMMSEDSFGNSGVKPILDMRRPTTSTKYIPSSEQMRAVRMVVKHLHFFVNSASIPHHGGDRAHNPMDLFKRDLWAPHLKRKLYTFLRYSFENWPMDASFRLVLETWLSYIQPWRYTNLGLFKDNNENADVKDLSQWHPFIIQNNKFYTTLFKTVMNRFVRMDFGCNKNAYMMFRICKVFQQGDLKDFLKAVDLSTNSTAGDNTLKSTPPRMNHLDMSSLIGYTHQNPQEIYGSDRLFDSIFDYDFKASIHHMMEVIIFPAYADLKRLQASLNQRTKNQQFNFWKFIFGGRSSNGSHDNSLDEVDIEDTNKSIGYLDFVIAHLVNIFDLDPAFTERLKELQKHQPVVETSCLHDNDLSFNETCNNLPKPLSPHDRYNIIHRKQKADVRYTGNPDTVVIRTDEVAFLVRLLHNLSLKINDKWTAQFESFYHRDDVFGVITRQILKEPCFYYVNEKRFLGYSSPLEKQSLPPRVYLRPLASYKTLFFLGLFYFFYAIILRRTFISSSISLVSWIFFGLIVQVLWHYLKECIGKC